jgi:predicted transcriptional regulator
MRLKILQALHARPLTVGEIVDATGATQSHISKHPELQASSGVIARHKRASLSPTE